jgi:hypothetical protein
MREEIEKLRDGLIAKADDVDNYRQFEVLTTVIRFLNTILANHPEKPSEGQETPVIGNLVDTWRQNKASFTEGYTQGLEAAADYVDIRCSKNIADTLRSEAVRIRGLK